MISSYVKKRLIKYAVYDKITGCLNSLYASRSDSGRGYPQTMMNYKVRKIHRALLELKLNRELNSNEYALHKCNNRLCISTAKGHVVNGNNSENQLDAVKAGTHYKSHISRRTWKY